MIFNPVAGRSFYQPEKPVEQIANALRKHVGEVVLLPTTPERRAETLARQALADGCDLIAPLGGDGTINEALQAVAGTPAVLLPLPGGTANVLAREIGLGLDPLRAVASLPSLVERKVSLGVVTFTATGDTRLFLLMCGAGFDANAVYQVNAGLKRQVGIFAYVVSGLRQLVQPLRAITVKIGDEYWTGGLVVISKSRVYGAGFVLTSQAHLLAERFDIVCFRSQSPLGYPGYLAAVITRTLDRLKGVIHRQFATVEVVGQETAGVYVQVDGELAGSLPIEVRLGPEHLNLLGPPEYWSRLKVDG